MRLTSFSDYTLRVLMYLALEPERLATISEIAEAYGISRNHLMKVVHQLARSGVVESLRGKGGGIRLARPAEEIHLGAVIRASEGKAPIVECLDTTANSCCITAGCQLTSILERAFEAFFATLDEFTLADLMARQQVLTRLLRRPDGVQVQWFTD